MKNKLLIVISLILAFFISPFGLQAETYISENFDSESFVAGVPDGWDNSEGTTTTQTYKWNKVIPGYGGDGACLKFNSYNNFEENTNILKTPSFALVPGSPATLKFVFKNPKGGDLSVYVYSATDGLSLLESDLKASEWTEKEYSLLQYAGKTISIQFHSTSNCGIGDAYHYLDNVVVKDPPLCAQPIGVSVSTLSQTQAVIGWALDVASAMPDKYRIRVTKVADDTVVLSDNNLVAQALNTTITGLEPGTEYNVTLIGDCQSVYKGLSEESAPLRFVTLLDPVGLPYEQNFNASPDMPVGVLGFGKSVVSNSVVHGSGGNALAMSATATESSMTVFQQISHPVNDIQCVVWLRGSVSNTKFSIGLISDPYDPSTFIPVLEDSLATSGVWNEIRFNTANIASPQSNQSVAILLPDGKSATLYADDLKLTTIPSCPRPERLSVLSSDSISARLKWDGKNAPLARQACLMTSSDTSYQLISANPGMVTNLADNTDYTVKVRDICAVGDTSEWSTEVSFHTSCKVATSAPFSYDFNDLPLETLPGCWSQKQSIKGSGYGSDYGDNAWVSSTYSGEKCMKLKDCRAGTHSLLISHAFLVDEIGGYDVEFSLLRDMRSADKEGVVLWINNTPDTVGAQKCAFIPSSCLREPSVNTSGWYKYTYPVMKQGVVYIIFEGISQYKSPSYIDNVKVTKAPSCRSIKQSTVSLSDVTQTSAKLNWQSPFNVPSTVVRYTLVSATDSVSDEVLVSHPAADLQSQIFNNLTPATGYTLSCRLAGYCGGTDTSAWVSFSTEFTTKCNAFDLPLHEDFEAEVVPPLCWSVSQSGNYWQSFTSAAYGSAAKMVSNSSLNHPLLISPSFNCEVDDYWVVFSMHRRNESDYAYYSPDTIEGIKIWINSTPEVGGTLVCYMRANKEIEPVEDEIGIQEYIYGFRSENAGVKYLIVEGIGDSEDAVYLYDIKIAKAPSCLPLNKNFTVSAVSDTSISVTLADEDRAVWEVQYGVAGFELGTGTIKSFTTSTATISGLLQNTNYEVYIRRVCDGEFSEWSIAKSVYTFCAPFEITATNEFFEDFESYTDEELITGCFLDAPQGSYVMSSTAKSSDRGISAYKGNMFSKQRFSYHQVRYVAVKLRAGQSYEASGYFVQDYENPGHTTVSVVLSNTISYEGQLLASIDVVNTWAPLKAFFTVPDDGVYYIGFRIDQDGTPWLSGMDNLRIRELNCVPPFSTFLSDIKSNSAKIEWTSSNTLWEVKVADHLPDDLDQSTGWVLHDTVADKFINVAGLSQNTEYYYFVRSLCAEGYSDWTLPQSFRTQCDAINLPYMLDFENKELPELLCWTIQGENSRVERVTSYKYGTGGLLAKNTTLISPQIAEESLANCMLTGWVKTDKDSVVFEIGVMTDITDVTTYEPMGQVSVFTKNQWQEFTAYFNLLASPDYAHVADAKYVVVTLNAADVGFYLDNLAIDFIPTCPKPTEPQISNVDANSFDLAWRANAGESQWRVQVMSRGVLVKDTVVAQNPTTITGLPASTTYSVFLRGICSTSDTSAVLECGSLTTPCDVYTLPYNLIIGDDRGLPNCWEKGFGTSSPGLDWRIYSLGGKPVLRYDDYNSYNELYGSILSPIINLTDAESAVLKMSVQNYKSRGLNVIVHDLTSQSVDTVARYQPEISSEFKNIELNISQYVGSQIQIELFAIAGPNMYCNVMVKSFKVVPFNSCIMPVGLIAVNAFENKVNMQITDTIAEHDTWEYVYGAVDFNPYLATPTVVKSNSFEIVNQEPNSRLEVYVRTVCGNNEYSDWFGPVEVKTQCGIQSLPYYEGFESYSSVSNSNACFSLLNEYADGGSYPAALLATATYLSEGEQGLQFKSSSTEPLFFVLPQFDGNINTLKLRFDYRNEGVSFYNGTLIVGVMSSVSDTSTFIPVYECPKVETFQTKVVYFDDVAAIDDSFTGRIAFKYVGGIANNYYVGLDAISVLSALECVAVEKLISLGVTKNSALFKLQSERVSPQYQVAYGIGVQTPDECDHFALFDKDTIEVANLLPGTEYTFFARSICAAGDTSVWSNAAHVSTLCDTYVLNKGDQYVENFDDGVFPTCIYRLQTSVSGGVEYPALSTLNTINGTNSIKLSGVNAIMLPVFNMPLNRLKLSFFVSGGSTVYIGTVNMSDYNDYNVITSYYAPTATSQVVEDLSLKDNLEGEALVIYTQSSYATVYIDSLVVEWAPTCYAPRNPVVSNVSDTSAVVFWSSAPDATMNQCMICSDSDTVYADLAGDTLLVGNLTNATEYTVNIRSICAENDTTEWATTEFKTLPRPAIVPYASGFEETDDYASWVFVNGPQYSDQLIVGKDPSAVRTGTNALYVSENDSIYQYVGSDSYYDDYYGEYEYDHERFFAYRTFYLEPGQYSYSFDWQCSSISSYNYGMLFIMPEGENLYAGMDYQTKYQMLTDRLNNQSDWTTYSGSFVVPDTALYRFVFAWDQWYYATGTPLTVDNITIVKNDCAELVDLDVSEILTNSALVTFTNINIGNQTEYYYVCDNFTSDTAIVTNNSIALSGLFADTEYTLYVRSVCGDFYTDWQSINFVTECEPVVIDENNPYFEGFEEYTTDLGRLDNCWSESFKTNGHFEVRTAVDNHGREPFEGSNYITLRYSNASSIVRPFSLKAGKSYAISFKVKLDIANVNCKAQIVTRSNNAKVVLAEIPLNSTSWQEVLYDLNVENDTIYYLGLAGDLNSAPYYMSVDNFSIEEVAWGTPSNLVVSNVAATEATFSWNGNSTDYQIQISTGGMIIQDTVVAAKTFHSTALAPATSYVVNVRCNENGKYSRWASARFITECASSTVPYILTFSDGVDGDDIPLCWDAVSGSVGAGYISWYVNEVNNDSVLYLNVSGTQGLNTIKSNAVYLPDANNLLSFDYFNNSSNDTLVVLLSSDNGASFTDTLLKAPKTAERQMYTFNLQNYANDTIVVAFMCRVSRKGTADYVYVDNFRVNCMADEVVYHGEICPGNQYIGHGFEIPSTANMQSGTYEYSRLNKATILGECDYMEKLILTVKSGGTFVVNASICEGDVYVSDAFPNGITLPGQYKQLLTSSSGCDSTVLLNLSVSNPRYSYFDTICDTQTYLFAGKELTASGVYADTIDIPESTCDSIVTLNLTVLQTRFESSKTVCEDEQYRWLDTILTTTGVYTRKYTNKFGCDSIITIDFEVLEKNFVVDSTICAGQSVKFGTNTYSESGTYTVIFENYLKCDSIVTLNLKVTKPDTLDISDFVCEGKTYFGNGYQDLVVTKDTVLINTTKDKLGCITINRLSLDMIETIYYDTTVTIKSGDVYVFGGNSLSQAGEYEDVFVSSEGCDSVVNLTLQVITGIDYVKTQSLVLAPNPIKRGETTYIHRTWASEEQSGLLLEVLDGLGKVLSRQVPDKFPIEVPAIEVSGVYYIRIISGTGDVYLGKLIVK